MSKLFAKIRDTMPPLNAAQVSLNSKADILAYLFEIKGFPSGSSELPSDTAALDSVQIVRKDAANALPNFVLVQLVGCLEPAANGQWLLTRATEPVAVKEDSTSATSIRAAEGSPLGLGKFDLVSVSRAYQAEAHRGHKMEARGLLYRDSAYSEINLTSLTMVSATCAN